MWRRLKAWLFRGGDYPDKGVHADRPLLDRLVANLNSTSAGAAPKLDLEHGPTEAVLDFGRAVPGSARVEHGAPPGGEQGDWVVSDVEVAPAVDDLLQKRGLSILLDPDAGRIEKIAVTANPRVAGAQFDAGDGQVVIPGGHLMLKRFNQGEPGSTTDPNEPELSDGFIARLRTKLGLGDGGQASEGAGAPPADDGQPQFSEDDQAFLNDPRTKALTASFGSRLSAMEQQLAAAQQTAATAGSMALENGIKAFSAELLTKGAPPWMVEILAPFAVGATSAKVAFTSGTGETATVAFKDLDFKAAALLALEKASNPERFTRLLPVDDTREADPDQQAAELAKQIKQQHPEFSISHCQDLADQQLKGQTAMTGSH